MRIHPAHAFGLVLLCSCRSQVTSDASAPTPTPTPAGDASEPAVPAGRVTVKPLDGTEYRDKLFRGFETCGNHQFTELGGQWLAVAPQRRDMWLCEGRMLWVADWGGTSELCISSFDAAHHTGEMIYHEDVHDPGDASGHYVDLRYDGKRLTIEVAGWETPDEWETWFVLERKAGVTVDARAPCPLDWGRE